MAESEKLKQRLKQLLALPQNRVCCDCSMVGPTWASKNLGVFVCLDCAGVHRSMGTHISQVRSVDLDSWVPAWVSVMESVGNAIGNSCWEARMPPGKKITPSVSKEARTAFIREKYERKAFYSPREEGAVAAPVLSAAEQRKQTRLARLNANNSTSPLPSPTKESTHNQVPSASIPTPATMDLFSGMTVKTTAPVLPVLNLFEGMSISSSTPTPAAPLSLSPAPSSSNSLDLLNLDNIVVQENGFAFSQSPTPNKHDLSEFVSW